MNAKKQRFKQAKRQRVTANVAYYIRQGINPFQDKQAGHYFAGLVKDSRGNVYTRDSRGSRLIGQIQQP